MPPEEAAAAINYAIEQDADERAWARWIGPKISYQSEIGFREFVESLGGSKPETLKTTEEIYADTDSAFEGV